MATVNLDANSGTNTVTTPVKLTQSGRRATTPKSSGSLVESSLRRSTSLKRRRRQPILTVRNVSFLIGIPMISLLLYSTMEGIDSDGVQFTSIDSELGLRAARPGPSGGTAKVDAAPASSPQSSELESRSKKSGLTASTTEVSPDEAPVLEVHKLIIGSNPIPVVVCRLYGVCRDRAGTLYTLPLKKNGISEESADENARRLATLATTKCGRTFRAMSLEANETIDTIPLVSDKDVLFGGNPSGSGEKSTVFRYHMPHFMTDFLPAFVGWDGLIQLYNGSLAESSPPQLFNADGSFISSTKTFGPPILDGVILMEDRFAQQASTSQWVGNLLGMVPLSPITTKQLRTSNPGPRKVCFRSGVMVPKSNAFVDKYMAGVGTPHSHHDFYSRNSLLRHREDQPGCHLKVAILNREFAVGSGRNFPNVNELAEAISLLPSNITRNVEIQTGIHYMSSLSFNEQRTLMQTADIIVSVHGAELTNLFFARSGALLIEVMPYAYPAAIFQSQAITMGMLYRSLVAPPDVQGFTDCITKYNPAHVAKEAAALFADKAAAAEASKMFSNFDATAKQLVPDLIFQHQCARSQRLYADVGAVVDLIKHYTESECSSPK